MPARCLSGTLRRQLGWLFLVSTLLLGGIGPRASGQTFMRYGTEEGLPSVAVTGVAEDAQGFLWVTTLNGLCRFDVIAFDCRLHDPDDPTTPAVDYLWGDPLLVDAAGTLWLGTGRGVQRYDPTIGAFVRDDYRAVPSESAILAAALDGTLWIGHDSGLDHYEPGGGLRRTYTQADGLLSDNITELMVDPSTGALWVGTQHGVQRIEAGAVVQTVRTGAMVYGLHPHGSGAILVGTFGEGVWLVQEDGAPRPISLPSGTGQITAIREADEESLWIGTWEGGLLRLDQETLAVLAHIRADPTSPYSLPSNKITGVFVDASGVTWVPTWDGLARLLDASPFVTLPGPETVGPMVTALAGAPGGPLWIGTSAGLYHLDPTVPSEGPYPTPQLWTPSGARLAGTVRGLAPEPDGGVWVGLETGGLGLFHPERGWAPLAPAVLPREVPIYQLLLDRRSRLWVTTAGGGVCVIEPSREVSRCFSADSPAPHSLPTGQTYALEELADGSIALGTLGGGVLRIAPDLSRIEPYPVRSGQDELGRVLARARITTLEAIPDRTLWVGTLDGLFRIDAEGTVQYFSEADGLPHRTINCIQQDAQGMLWMNTGAGLVMLDPEGSRFAQFGEADMVPPLSPYFGTCGQHADALWMGSRSGLVGFVPERVRTVEAPPPILVTAVEMDGRVVARMAAETKPLRIPASVEQVTIAFAGIDHRRPEGLRYAYVLEGGVDTWVDVGSEQQVTFSQLRPGTYTFRVRATSSLGVVGVQEAVVPLTVLEPFWLRPWFVGLVLMLAALAAWGGHRYHLHRRLEVERTRLRIAQDLHDDISSQVAALGMQMHAVEGMVGEGDPAAMRALLAHCQEHVQTLSAAVRDLVWVVGTERGTLGDLVRRVEEVAYALLPEAEVNVMAEGDTTLPLAMQARKHLLFFCKEALHNAAKHAEATLVRVHFTLHGEALVLRVADDGRGFPEDVMLGEGATAPTNPLLAHGDGVPARGGHGLRSLRSRARALRGALHTHSAPGDGVEHVLTVPRPILTDRNANDAERHRRRIGAVT